MGNLCNKKSQDPSIIPKQKAETPPQPPQPKFTEKDFTKIKLIGKGSYGNVYLVRYNKNNQIYAMKVYIKSDIREKNQESNTKSERNLMTQINFPFIVSVKFAFQTESKLFLVQEFIQGGDLFFHIHSGPRFPNEKAKFYIVEIILAIEFLHNNNMIYRDLKPENILIGNDGHIKLTDFGLSKSVESINNKSYTICGTLQYLAPEIMGGEGYDASVDWWSLGIILYEMLTSKLPFKFKFNGDNNLAIYKKKIIYPSWMDENAKDLISKLLIIDPSKRIGNGVNKSDDIRNHPYFSDIDWNKAMKKELEPPFVPKLEDETDIKYFEKSLKESPVFSDNSGLVISNEENENDEEDNYEGFTFVASSYKELCDMGKNDI